ncbi:MAG: c-type cytochrome [Bacteroidota bacterium]
MKKNVMILLTSAFAFVLMAFVSKTANDPWPVPDKYLKMTNPVKPDAASIATGKELYVQHCQSCHGKKGKGDGSKAAQLDTECGDFTTAAFKNNRMAPCSTKPLKDVKTCRLQKENSGC